VSATQQLNPNPGLPFATRDTLGGAAAIHYQLAFARDPIVCMRTVFERYGAFVAFKPRGPVRLVLKPTIFAAGAAYNKAVLSDTGLWRTSRLLQTGPRNSALRRIGSNLISMNWRKHAYYRKLVSTPLRRSNIDGLGVDFGREVDEAVEQWPRGKADLFALSKGLMRRVSIALLFGDDQERGLRLSRSLEELILLNGSPATALCPMNVPGLPYWRLLRGARGLERLAIDFIAAKRGHLDTRDLASIIANAPDEQGAAPCDADVAGHIPILFAATYETCQTVLTWTLFLIAQHPSVARSLVAEIAAIRRDTPLCLDDVVDLPVLDAVVRESMRILPAVPYQLRAAMTDTQIDGHAVESGTRVILNAYQTNRDPAVYDHPDRFAPERWSHIDPSPFQHLTFSAGPRTCPGSWFGTSAVKLCIAAILSRFRITVVPGTRIDRRVSITMSPRNGLPVVLHDADNNWRTSPVTGQITEMVDFGSA
jgi:cytochrome P450